MAKPKNKKKRKQVRRRKPVRQELPSQAPTYPAFFRMVFGKLPTTEQKLSAHKKLNRIFAKELMSKFTSLERRRQLWNEATELYARVVKPSLKQMSLDFLKKHGNFAVTDNVASFGSGLGVMEAYLAKYVVPNGKVACVDFSAKMNEFASMVKERAQVENMSIITTSAAQSGLPTHSQNKVLMLFTNLVQTEHFQPILTEVRRVLKPSPDAKFIFSFIVSTMEQAPNVKKVLEKNDFEFTISRHGSYGGVKMVVIAKPKQN